MSATYTPAEVTQNFLGNILNGWDEVEVSRDSDRNTFETSTDGRALRIVSLDKRGTITIRTPMDSPANDKLSAAFALDELTNAGMGPFALAHFGGTTVVQASETCVARPPAVIFNNGKTQREWVLRCAKIDIFAGGIPG
jgi:hypothetical protein